MVKTGDERRSGRSVQAARYDDDKTKLKFNIVKYSHIFNTYKKIFSEIYALLFSYLYRTLAKGLECSPMARETWVQSQVESYQRLKKWYLMPPCLTLSIIRYGSRVK